MNAWDTDMVNRFIELTMKVIDPNTSLTDGESISSICLTTKESISGISFVDEIFVTPTTTSSTTLPTTPNSLTICLISFPFS